MIDETRYPERIWARRYSDVAVGARDRPEPYSPLPDGYPFVEYVRKDLYEAERQRAEKAEAALAAFAEPNNWFDVEDSIDEQVYPAWRGPVAEPEAFARAALRNDGGDDG